ncbi:extracellular solute-binding protein [Petroclostridium sp. X23]|uniref:extracellular solute-binding protein n=1 Tax=Petroclostridium sp. X23 TaxID=3045146 RepID=UPI0024AE57A7|nr:extracellular solute-binding protein [Petroclostridium sp. X23]WHH61161.1 extracellular solute-binding protein [Petroclostridium sp. X23]
MTKYKVILSILFCLAVVTLMMIGCSQWNTPKEPLDPAHPATITLWNYYSGQTKEKFDQLVSRFNETVGMEKGIVVDALSQGDVQQLANTVFDAANNKIGSQPLPHIFAAYPDNAYRINQISPLVDMETYFSKEELKEFRQDFMDEGRFGEENKLKILPIAKSTENLFLNKTYWDAFEAETGADINELSTWEGVARIAEKYYEWTDAKTPEINDGKAFIGIDSPSNYMLVASMQLNEDMYIFEGEGVKLNFNEKFVRKIWDNFYVPYLKGYYTKTGRFCSDDAKTGTVIAYVGSTAGAAYFPREITLSKTEIYPIESEALPYPCFEHGENYAIQQGAGMCITKSDPAHEYAAALFLKWFTAKEQNVEFAVSTGYFPVKTASLNEALILSASHKVDVDALNPTITNSIKATLKMMDAYKLYGNKPFNGSYDMRRLLETSMFQQVQKDLQYIEENTQKGEDRNQRIEHLLSEENFKKWYFQFMQETAAILR